MRKGWRKAFWGMGMLLLGAMAYARPPGPRKDASVHLTAELQWSTPANAEPTPIELALNEGRIVEARAWSAQGPGEPLAAADGDGKVEASRAGRFRERLEAPPSAVITVRAGGKATLFPVSTLLEGPQRSPETSSVEVRVERVAWDSLEVHWDGDGVVSPGAPISLGVGLNILAPDATEVAVRLSLLVRSLHGGEVLAQVDRTEVVVPNCPDPTIRAISTNAAMLV